MDLDAYMEELRTRGEYHTDPARIRHRFGRLPLLPSIAYHFGATMCVIRGNRAARIGQFDGRRWQHESLRAQRAVERAGGQVHITGYKNLTEANGPVVYIGNHMSLLETLLLPCLLVEFSHVCFVVKQSLLDYPVFGTIMRSVRPIAVSRKNPREDLKQVLTQGVEELGKGNSVCVFPQATRSTGFDETKFNSLGVKLATRAGVPCVPMALCTDFLPNGRFIKDFSFVRPCNPVRIAFGPVLTGPNAKLRHQACADFIRTKFAEWGLQTNTPDDPEE